MTYLKFFKPTLKFQLVEKGLKRFLVLVLLQGVISTSFVLAASSFSEKSKEESSGSSSKENPETPAKESPSIKEKAQEMVVGAMDTAKELPGRVREGIHAATAPSGSLGKEEHPKSDKHESGEDNDKSSPKACEEEGKKEKGSH